MTSGQVPFQRGESAVAVPVPAAEPVVSAWRARLDSSAAFGIPAHVTVVYPFLPAVRLSDAVLADLRVECAATAPMDVAFNRTARFTGVLYLVPEPTAGLRALTARFARRWPDAPPYGGRYDDVVPHLTVAEGPDSVLDAVEREVGPRLPVTATLEMAELYVFDGRRFRVRERLPFGAPGGE